MKKIIAIAIGTFLANCASASQPFDAWVQASLSYTIYGWSGSPEGRIIEAFSPSSEFYEENNPFGGYHLDRKSMSTYIGRNDLPTSYAKIELRLTYILALVAAPNSLIPVNFNGTFGANTHPQLLNSDNYEAPDRRRLSAGASFYIEQNAPNYSTGFAASIFSDHLDGLADRFATERIFSQNGVFAAERVGSDSLELINSVALKNYISVSTTTGESLTFTSNPVDGGWREATRYSRQQEQYTNQLETSGAFSGRINLLTDNNGFAYATAWSNVGTYKDATSFDTYWLDGINDWENGNQDHGSAFIRIELSGFSIDPLYVSPDPSITPTIQAAPWITFSSAVPEPATNAYLLAGLASAALLQSSRRKKCRKMK